MQIQIRNQVCVKFSSPRAPTCDFTSTATICNMAGSRIWKPKWNRVVSEVCDELQLRPDDVGKRFAYQVVRLTDALYHCRSCKNQWSTHVAWILINCKKRKVLRGWKQKCLKCKVECTSFGIKENMLRQAVLRGVLRCLEKSDGIFAFLGGSGSDNANLEHKHELCEKCDYGAVNCISGETLGSLLDGLHITHVPAIATCPLPTHFINDGWTSWRDSTRLLPTLLQRQARAVALHEVKTSLVANRDLRVDTQYKQGVYEAGSLKKGTQLPVSDIDVVLFVTDFRADQDYITRRLNDVTTCLRASFRERMGPILNHNRRFSRTFAIQTQANEIQYSIKFDILLGSQLDSPGSFIPWSRWVRSYSVADSLFYYTSTHSMLHIFRTYTT